MRYRARLLVLLPTIALTLSGCGGGGGIIGGPSTTLTITNKITTLQAGQSYQFNINEQHDQGAGFTLTLSGKGTLSPSGPGALYIAPPAVPSPNSVTVTATAANGSNVSDSDTFTITAAPGPVVSISPATFMLTGGGLATTLTISVTQDGPADQLSGGVASGPTCNGSCGSFGPFVGTPGSGSYTVLFFPANSVTATTTTQVQVFSSLANSTTGTALATLNTGTAANACPVQGHEMALIAGYSRWIFLLQGENGGHPLAMAGVFAPDGNGGINSGTMNINVSGSAPNTDLFINPATSDYSLDSTGHGCLELGTALGRKVFHFALQGLSNPNATGGQIMEYDDTTGTGERAVGTFEFGAQGGSSTNATFHGGVFGLSGWDLAGGHVAMAGSLATDGAGKITGGLADTDDAGTVNAAVAIPAGAYSVDPTGRGTFSFMNGATPLNGVFYLGSDQHLFIFLSTDQVSSTVPLLSGRGGGPATALATGANYLFADAGKDNATIERANLSAAGALTGTLWQDAGGASATSAVSGTMTVTDSTWHRATFSGPGTGHAPVAYTGQSVVSINALAGFTVGTSGDAESGTIVLQSALPANFGNATLGFPVAYSDVQHTASGITTAVGIVKFDAKGGITGTLDLSGPSGLQPNISFAGAYSVNPDGTGVLGGQPMVIQYEVINQPHGLPSITNCLIHFIDETAGAIHPVVSTAAK